MDNVKVKGQLTEQSMQLRDIHDERILIIKYIRRIGRKAVGIMNQLLLEFFYDDAMKILRAFNSREKNQ